MTMRFTAPNTFEDILSGVADTFGLIKDVKPLAKKNVALSRALP